MASLEALSAPSAKRSKTKEEVTPSQKFMVIHTTYPSSYGCYHGRRWTKLELIQRSNINEKGPFTTYEEAFETARITRTKHDFLFESLFEDMKEEDVPLPWDSGDDACGNGDDDEHHRIEIITEADLSQRKENTAAYLNLSTKKHQLKEAISNAMIQAQVTASGRPHYSNPAQSYDIKADLEVKDSDIGYSEALKVIGSMDTSKIKSLRFEETSQGLSNAESKAHNPKECLLLTTSKACPNIEEIHYSCDSLYIDTDSFIKVLTECPHLSQTLKMIRFSGGLSLSPKFLSELAEFNFPLLERSDFSHSFTSEHSDFSSMFYPSGAGYDSEEDEANDEFTNEFKLNGDSGVPGSKGYRNPFKGGGKYPFNKPLVDLVCSCPKLKQLDLGCGDAESQRYLFEYSLSHGAVHYLQTTFEHLSITLSPQYSPLPHDFESEAQRTEAFNHVVLMLLEGDLKQEVLQMMMEGGGCDEEDDDDGEEEDDDDDEAASGSIWAHVDDDDKGDDDDDDDDGEAGC